MFSFFVNFVLTACFGSKHWLAQTTLVWIHCSCPALWLVSQLFLLLPINLSCSDVQDRDFHMVSVSLFQNTNIPEDSGARKMENFTFKAHRRAFLFALLIASIYAFGYAVKGAVWFFLFYHNEFFRKLNKSVLDCREVERNSKASVLFQYICCIRDFTGNCFFRKIFPTVLVLSVQQTWKGKQIIV